MFRFFVAASLLAPGVALACGNDPNCACKHGAEQAAAAADPAACAKKAELVGGNCSYTTGMMAQRVLSEGKPWTFTGRLVKDDNALDSHVAAPFVVGPDRVHVVANEVIETMSASGATASRVTVEGRLLEVDGLRYFVITRYDASNT